MSQGNMFRRRLFRTVTCLRRSLTQAYRVIVRYRQRVNPDETGIRERMSLLSNYKLSHKWLSTLRTFERVLCEDVGASKRSTSSIQLPSIELTRATWPLLAEVRWVTVCAVAAPIRSTVEAHATTSDGVCSATGASAASAAIPPRISSATRCEGGHWLNTAL